MADDWKDEHSLYLVALAGLLHDVGKFAQRAGWREGKHTQVGSDFASAYVPEAWRQYLYSVLGHPDKPLEGYATKVVALADRLSAAEREGTAKAEPRQLVSILCRVGEEEQRPGHKFWPLRPLTLQEETIFPHDRLPREEEGRAYNVLWKGFIEAVESLPTDDLPAYVVGMYDALQRFTWCVPGAYYRSIPDVSLFDHSRATAALAVCLSGFDEDRLDAWLACRRRDEPLALLIGGDVSGVQDFIYTITAKGAAKGLRGRSFYLEMLTDAVARYLLRQLGLPVTNLLYAGGGHFYFLAPLEAEAQLEALRAEVSRKLLMHHGGDLYLALGSTQASAADFDRQRFSEKWGAVSQAMSTAKRQRFSELDDADLLVEQVFGPVGQGGDERGECQVCYYDGPVTVERADTPDERRVCALCRSLEDLGRHLRDADYLLLGEVEPSNTARGGYADALRAFGMALGITAVDGSPVLRLPDDVRRATLLATRDLPDVGAMAGRISAHCGCPVAFGTRYAVNVTPHVSEADVEEAEELSLEELPTVDDVKEFGLLQAQAQGVKRLGVLRMDVDDLGALFKWGFSDGSTLSRVASFSFAVSLFFEGWVGALCRRLNAQGPDKVYAIYSGGDDLFIVGAWDALPGLADDIRRDLACFAASNPAVHVSGGLTLHGGKYPLYQAALDAERALDAAKDLERPQEGAHAKDAFNFLDVTVPWEDFDALRAEQETLTRLVEDLGVNRSLLRVLLRLYARATHRAGGQGRATWGPWMWRSAYVLKRMERGQPKEIKREIRRLRERLAGDAFRYIEVLGPAARWAELLIRKERE
jgi:CRISPR-associated protein Csm1